jgi:hypothetical protein
MNKKMTAHHNTLIGPYAGINITTAHHCLCLGENAGTDIVDEPYQIRIGKNANRESPDMVLIQEGNIVISRDIWDILTNQAFKNMPNLKKMLDEMTK